MPDGCWNAIRTYLHAGGNLLVIGGQPLHVPVTEADGKFVQATPQDTYARALQFNHTYAVPVSSPAHFAWKHGYAFGQTPAIRASRFFAVEGHLDGLGYMVDSTGLLAAAPVIVADYGWGPMQGSRVVALDFDPEPGYWESQDGIALMKQAALYASQGATELSVELQFSAIRPGETPQITVHLNSPHLEKTHAKLAGEVKVQVSLKMEPSIRSRFRLPMPQRPICLCLPRAIWLRASIRSRQRSARAPRSGSSIKTASGLNLRRLLIPDLSLECTATF